MPSKTQDDRQAAQTMQQRLRKPSQTTKSALTTQRSFETNKSGRRVSPSSSLPPATAGELIAEQQKLLEYAKQIPRQASLQTLDKEKLGQLHEALSSHPSDYLVPDDILVDEEKLPCSSNLSREVTATRLEQTSSSGSSTVSWDASTGLKEEQSARQHASPSPPALPPGLPVAKYSFWRRLRIAHALGACFSGSEAAKT